MVLKKVAVTGGLASGKSTVCRFLKELGAHVVSADEVVHKLLSPQTPLGQKVIDLLGSAIVVNKTFDRTRIAKEVFNHPTKLHSLESLLHPAVREEIERQYREVCETSPSQLFVAEIPLLFESEGNAFYDVTVAVVAPPEQCAKRFTTTTGYEEEEYNKRMSRQLSQEEKAKRAHFVIENKGTLDALRLQVQHLFQNLVK